MQFTPRPNEERGHADHGWLKTFHTFSFASYQDSKHNKHGPLRVINEDRVAPGTGFDPHRHEEFEIFSYVVSGELKHTDSMGNTEILKRGDVQLTSTGTGVVHSEACHGPAPVHFLQIWSLPSVSRLPPRYYTRHFSDEERKDRFVKVVAPIDSVATSSGGEEVVDEREGPGPAPVHSPLTMYAGLLSPGLGQDGRFGVKMTGTRGYIQVVQTSGYNVGEARGAGIRIRGYETGVLGGGAEVTLREGDGVYIDAGSEGGELKVESVGEVVAEVLLFDLE
ncbi:hypothetical protein AX16_003350 [Volvariella volvacea WC 439]|nr:hypothetical protein AX16_003350 [Volvariella volvacea WC 439]